MCIQGFCRVVNFEKFSSFKWKERLIKCMTWSLTFNPITCNTTFNQSNDFFQNVFPRTSVYHRNDFLEKSIFKKSVSQNPWNSDFSPFPRTYFFAGRCQFDWDFSQIPQKMENLTLLHLKWYFDPLFSRIFRIKIQAKTEEGISAASITHLFAIFVFFKNKRMYKKEHFKCKILERKRRHHSCERLWLLNTIREMMSPTMKLGRGFRWGWTKNKHMSRGWYVIR